jgi:hypothetical protein
MAKKKTDRAVNGVKVNFTDAEFSDVLRAWKRSDERTVGPWVRKAALRVARES